MQLVLTLAHAVSHHVLDSCKEDVQKKAMKNYWYVAASRFIIIRFCNPKEASNPISVCAAVDFIVF
ncbi:hypothetical protein FOLKNPGA_00619 [Legionella sp. PC1000]|nr:hypothetical protein FOLKNPGA_00619 [Legionella sp. PC1000]